MKESKYWTGPTCKMEYCQMRGIYRVLVYGNPYSEVYSGEKAKAETILCAFVTIGYIDKTDYSDEKLR